jgi:hypothetical protein
LEFIQEFKLGVDAMKETKSMVDNDGYTSFMGKPVCYLSIVSYMPTKLFPQAISAISNGILRDPRVFYMDRPQNWFEMYDRQGIIIYHENISY